MGVRKCKIKDKNYGNEVFDVHSILNFEGFTIVNVYHNFYRTKTIGFFLSEVELQ